MRRPSTAWRDAVGLVLQTFREQQRKTGDGPYHFMRRSEFPTDSLPGRGYWPARTARRTHPLDVPPQRRFNDFSLFDPVELLRGGRVLRQAGRCWIKSIRTPRLAAQCRALADEVDKALREYAIVNHPKVGRIFAFEVDAYGNYYCIDDANVPNLLSLPYLGAVKSDDPIYQATRQFVLSDMNPYYFKGKAAEGPGGPHAGRNMIWPLGIAIRALTAADNSEIRACLDTLQKTHAGTGFIHEAFHKDDPRKFTRPWFAWANTLFGELILKLHNERPYLLD